MTARLEITILGCGSSGGVPRLGGDWGDCDPADPRNTRRRCSILVSRRTAQGVTRVLIDTSPDMRAQLLDAGVGTLDAVLYTHAHADHVHGIDDLRMIVHNMRKRLQVWADGETADALISRFGYAFVQPKGSSYPPICDLNTLDGPVTISGAGGPLTLIPFSVDHGSIKALGFRIAGVAYLPDVSAIPDAVAVFLIAVAGLGPSSSCARTNSSASSSADRPRMRRGEESRSWAVNSDRPSQVKVSAISNSTQEPAGP